MKTLTTIGVILLLTASLFYIGDSVYANTKGTRTHRDSIQTTTIFRVGGEYKTIMMDGRGYRFFVVEIGPSGWLRIKRTRKDKPLWLNSNQFREVTVE